MTKKIIAITGSYRRGGVIDQAVADASDDGEWVYVSNSGSDEWGRINIECYHTDLKGTVWSTH